MTFPNYWSKNQKICGGPLEKMSSFRENNQKIKIFHQQLTAWLSTSSVPTTSATSGSMHCSLKQTSLHQ